jgi:hypothetical protein
MSTSLAFLVARLETAIPAQNEVPSAAQYQQCCEDAVADYAERRPNQKVATIAVVSGGTTYALPADFLRQIQFEPLTGTEGVLVVTTGLIALDADFDEIYTFAGGFLTIYPTPAYTAARDLLYAAGHVLDSSDSYANLTAADARIVLLKAQQLALGLQANVSAQSGWKYQIGDEMVDKSGLGSKLREQGADLQRQYEDAILHAAGSVYGQRGWVSATR